MFQFLLLAPYLLALALDMCVTEVPAERAAAELLEVAQGSPMALLAARSLASALHKELPDDKRARLVVDLLTTAVRRARVEAFGAVLAVTVMYLALEGLKAMFSGID